jgi:hypothetical protein
MLLKLIKIIMAKIEHRKFIPNQEEREKGAVPMDKAEIVEQLARYKAQNPVKYAQKKEALFKRYGLDIEDEKPEVKDENDVELEKLAAKVKKTK